MKYIVLLILTVVILFLRKRNKEYFIRGLPSRTSKFERNTKLKLTNWDPHNRGYKKKDTESEKLMKMYLNKISEPVSHNGNVLPSSIFFVKGQKYFAQDKSLAMITDKYKELKENLKKLKNFKNHNFTDIKQYHTSNIKI